MFRFGAGLGPFLYCDYWASVLNLQGVVSPFVLADGRLSLSHFRRAVDRPRTRLPKLRYYILAFIFLPVLMPYRVVYDLMRLFRGGRVERLGHPVDAIISRHELDLEFEEASRVRVTADNGKALVAEGLLDPALVRCEVSLFFPTYKLLAAGIFSLILSAGVLPHLGRVTFLAPLAAHLDIVLYVLLAAALMGVLRDPLTAFVAPLPILAFHMLWRRPESPGGLLLMSAGFVLLFYLVEWFLIPRGLPPTLYLYVNEPQHRAFPYRPGQAPYWLRGRHYWVWRFVSLVPGELLKFWERDWERVECWVRADGPEAGRLEWVVGDFHYRELWYEVDRLASPARRAAQKLLLAARARPDSAEEPGRTPLVWLLEVDMDPVYHAPYVRGLFLVQEDEMGWRKRLRRLGEALASGTKRDRFRQFAVRLEELEMSGEDLFSDVPEHFRWFTLHQVIGLPWTYWRYPMGARSTARRFVYGSSESIQASSAADRFFQIKEPPPEWAEGERRPAAEDGGAASELGTAGPEPETAKAEARADRVKAGEFRRAPAPKGEEGGSWSRRS